MGNARTYATRAFDLGRGFKHVWSVNFKWVPCAPRPPDEITDLADCDGAFSSKAFKLATLGAHAGLLLLFADRVWLRDRGGFIAFFRRPTERGPFGPRDVALLLFTCNLIGVACARSLHFQFVVWYANSLPLLLARAPIIPVLGRIALLLAVEAAWNPWRSETSSVASSLLLTASHAALLAALFASPLAKPPRGGKRA